MTNADVVCNVVSRICPCAMCVFSVQLPVDQVFLTAIRNLVMTHVEQLTQTKMPPGDKGVNPAVISMNKHQCNWDMKEGVDHQFFDTIKQLLLHVSDCSLAIACSGWIVKELPMGRSLSVNYSHHQKLKLNLDSVFMTSQQYKVTIQDL